MIERICLVCRKRFKTYPSLIKRGRGKYCSRKCSDQKTLIKKGQRLSMDTEFKKGQQHKWFKGYRYQISRKNGKKYKELYLPNHPNANRAGYIREHRLVIEKHIGRLLRKDEIVHHIDSDTLNNKKDNLELLDKREHDRRNTPLNIHRRWQKR